MIVLLAMWMKMYLVSRSRSVSATYFRCDQGQVLKITELNNSSGTAVGEDGTAWWLVGRLLYDAGWPGWCWWCSCNQDCQQGSLYYPIKCFFVVHENMCAMIMLNKLNYYISSCSLRLKIYSSVNLLPALNVGCNYAAKPSASHLIVYSR